MTIELSFESRPTTTNTQQTKHEPTHTTSTSTTIHVMRPLTIEILQSICRQEGDHYETMELNDSLRLSYAGLDMLCDAEQNFILSQLFPTLRALHADHNTLDQQCFKHLPNSIQSLYCDHNAISSLECIEPVFSLSLALSPSEPLHLSFTHFPHLITLDISHNPLRSLRGLAGLTQLRSLTAHHCELSDADELASLTKLRDVDLSFNQLKNLESVIASLQPSVSSLRVVHLSNNPGINEFPQYRRTLLSRFAQVRFMDNRPVSDDERASVNAWAQGGMEAEKQVRMDRMEEKRRKQEEQFEAWTAWKMRQGQQHQISNVPQTENRPASIEKRVEYRSVLNEDTANIEHKHEVSEPLAVQPSQAETSRSDTYNVLTSSPADSFMQSVISMLPSVNDSSSESDDDEDTVPFLFGLSELSVTTPKSQRSSRSIDHSVHNALRAVLQSTASQSPPSLSSLFHFMSSSTSEQPATALYEQEQKEVEPDMDDGEDYWNPRTVSAEPLVAPRSFMRVVAVSDNDSDNDEGEWTNDLSE